MLTGLAGEEVTSARCHYGTLPGGWLQTERRALLPEPADNSTHAVFPIWQPFCGKCQLKPLLTPYLAVSQALPAVHPADALRQLYSPADVQAAVYSGFCLCFEASAAGLLDADIQRTA